MILLGHCFFSLENWCFSTNSCKGFIVSLIYSCLKIQDTARSTKTLNVPSCKFLLHCSWWKCAGSIIASGSWSCIVTMVHAMGEIWTFYSSRSPENDLKVRLTLLSKTSKWKKLFTSQIFFFVSAASTSILSSTWKNNIILIVSKIQTMRKLNNPTKASFTGLFLTIVWFKLLKWWHSHKNKETFYPFFFI